VALLSTLLDRLEGEIGALEAGTSPVDRFRQVSVLDGRAVEVAVGDDRINGIAAGIADDGSLLLDAPAGRIALTAGEVVSVRDVAEIPA
jgi:biotin-(acetyl-CoA carboxylase) ligase